MEPYVKQHWGAWDPSLFTGNFKVERSKVIELGAKPIGFYELEVAGDVCTGHGIQIWPEYQAQGIGTTVLSAVEQELIARGVRTVRLRVFADNPARRLYERFGFSEVPQGPAAKPGTLTMEKKLS
jgi:GNAT superfamily N-acetyltransferase